ncbi:MAG: class I SAM-dependent methyltransferase [Thermomicrobiales bacterium]|nr:class I SAM-dependent methyltransferase [Thermomicrobiales bacterium]
MEKRSIDARLGYDLWAEDYDETVNPVVWIDAWALTDRLTVAPGERVLDAGCGTGRNFARLLDQGAELTGVDFSAGMLQIAQSKHPGVPLIQADLQGDWPFEARSFDLVVCALVGEHLGELGHVFRETRRVLADEGRLIFSVYHPAMAAAGKEARFIRGATEFRLGAFKHELDDYRTALERAGFARIEVVEFEGPPELAEAMPSKAKYVGFPLLVIFEAHAR